MEKLIAGAKSLGLSLDPEQVESFQVYYEELIRWNKRVNLTAIVDYEEVQLKHFLDSLTVALAFRDVPSLLLDVGAGAGMPGLPLKILLPNISLTLVDSTHRKTDFLNHLVTRLGLQGVEVLNARAEDLAHDEAYRERFDLVLSRGVAKLATLAELALPFCTLGGSFVAQKKGEIDGEIEAAARAIDILGGQLREVKRFRLEELGGERALVVIDKLSPTPQRYPRRAGIPQKRPLGPKDEKAGKPRQ